MIKIVFSAALGQITNVLRTEGLPDLLNRIKIDSAMAVTALGGCHTIQEMSNVDKQVEFVLR
jgi:hypothetical protein